MSRRPSANSFNSSSAKDYIRHNIDRRFIQDFRDMHYPDQKLAYIGLPSEELRDILSWREFINHCTAVENTAVTETLELNILKNRLDGIVRPVYADIDELLSPDSNIQLRWPYQIVNLDYIGGLVNARNDGSSRRIESIKHLFSKQSGAAFVLLITLNLRDNDKGEYDTLVNKLEESMTVLFPETAADCFDKHRSLGHAGLLKLYVPVFLDSVARYHSLSFVQPILYQGTKQMIHFAVKCIPYSEMAGGRISTTNEQLKLVNMPLLVLHSYDELKQVQLGVIA